MRQSRSEKKMGSTASDVVRAGAIFPVVATGHFDRRSSPLNLTRAGRRAPRAAWFAPTIAVLAMLSSSSVHALSVDGTFASPLGTLEIKETKGVVQARMKQAGGPCGFKVGDVVIEGSRLEDSITGSIKACKLGNGCKGEANGIAMLLVTRDGDLLSGAVHIDAAKCKTPFAGDGITLRRHAKKGAASDDEKVAKGDATTGDASAQTSTTPGKTDKGAKGEPKNGKPEKGNGASTKAPGDKPVRGDRNPDKDQRHASSTDGANTSGNRASTTDDGKGANAHGADDDGVESEAPSQTTFVKVGDRRRAESKAADGVPLLTSGKIEDARALFEEAVEIDPSYAEGWNLVGVTYYQRDRYDEALEMYKRALEANPSYQDPYYNMACIYALKKDKDQAISFLQIALLNGYVDLELIGHDADLKGLVGDERFEKLKRGDFFF